MKGRNILFVIHAWIDKNDKKRTSIGGTTLHVMDLIDSLKIDNNCFVLTLNGPRYHLYMYSKQEEKSYDLNVNATDFNFSSNNLEYKKMVSILLKDLDIDLVHIEHLVGHHYDLIDELKELKIKTITTLHDYFLICPQVNLLYRNISYCGDRNNCNCNKCLKNNNIDFKERKKRVGQLLELSSSVIVPNVSVANEFRQLYKDIDYKEIEHGISLEKEEIKPKKRNNNNLNVAFVGVMNYIKGSEVAKKVIEGMKKDNVTFHFFGAPVDYYFNKSKGNYINHGEYQRKEIISKLKKNNIDVVCLLTICPETYCYTLSEVIQAEIPVIGFDIGAIGSRIKKYDCGWVIPLKNMAKGVIYKIRDLNKDRKDLIEKTNNVKKVNINTVSMMIKETTSEYQKVLDSKDNLEGLSKYHSLIVNEGYIYLDSIKYKAKRRIVQAVLRLKNAVPYKVKRPFYLIYINIKKIVKRGRNDVSKK